MEVEGQDTSMTDTFDNLFVSILSKEKWIWSSLYSRSALMSMMASETWPWLTKRSAPAFQITWTMRQQYLGNIPTTFLASDYLGNYEEAKKVIDAIYKPTKEQLMKTYLKNSQPYPRL